MPVPIQDIQRPEKKKVSQIVSPYFVDYVIEFSPCSMSSYHSLVCDMFVQILEGLGHQNQISVVLYCTGFLSLKSKSIGYDYSFTVYTHASWLSKAPEEGHALCKWRGCGEVDVCFF